MQDRAGSYHMRRHALYVLQGERRRFIGGGETAAPAE
jgi:hypothetical protein